MNPKARSGRRPGGWLPAEELPDPAKRLLLNQREVAKLCGVTTRTVQEWRKSEGMPAVSLNGRLMYEPDAVKTWLASKRTKSPAASADVANS